MALVPKCHFLKTYFIYQLTEMKFFFFYTLMWRKPQLKIKHRLLGEVYGISTKLDLPEQACQIWFTWFKSVDFAWFLILKDEERSGRQKNFENKELEVGDSRLLANARAARKIFGNHPRSYLMHLKS